MILHTILSLQEVLYDKKSDRPRRYMRCPEGLIEIGEGNIICRVISTDPSAFLRSELTPGMPLPKQKPKSNSGMETVPLSSHWADSITSFWGVKN